MSATTISKNGTTVVIQEDGSVRIEGTQTIYCDFPHHIIGSRVFFPAQLSESPEGVICVRLNVMTTNLLQIAVRHDEQLHWSVAPSLEVGTPNDSMGHFTVVASGTTPDQQHILLIEPLITRAA